MDNIIWKSIRDEDGRIQNIMGHEEFIKATEKTGTMPDVYFCFLIKTMIDDFGDVLTKVAQTNKEQFEAKFMENLNEMLAQKTKV